MFQRKLIYWMGSAALCTLTFGCSGGPGGLQDSLDSPRTQAVTAAGWDILKLNSYGYADTQLDRLGHFVTSPNACRQDAAGAIDITLWNRIATLVNRGLTLMTLDDTNRICFDRSENSKLFGTVDVVTTISPPVAPMYVENNVPHPMISIPWPWSHPSHTPTPTPIPTISFRPSPTPTITPSSTPSSRPSASPSPSPSTMTRTILENYGNQICTKMNDQQLAHDLVDALDQLSAIAAKEDCERAP